MKEFFTALIYVVIYQIISWSAYAFFNEIIFDKTDWYGFVAGIAILIIGLFLYFIIARKITSNNKYNSKKYNISLFLLWFMSLLLGLKIEPHEIIKYLSFHDCTWFMCGFDYAIFWFGMCIQFIIIVLCKVMYKIYENVKNK